MDPVFQRLADATDRHVQGVMELTDREKAFILIVADVCNQTLGEPFERHVEAAAGHGVTGDDLRRLLAAVAFETGYPAARAALARLDDIAPTQTTDATGQQAQPATPLPDAVRAAWRDVDKAFADYMELQAGMVTTLPGISSRERAFAAITCDTLYQTLDETFRIHVGRAMGAGANEHDVKTVLAFTAQFGVARTWNAFRALDGHLSQMHQDSSPGRRSMPVDTPKTL